MGKTSWAICIVASIAAAALSIHLTGHAQALFEVFADSGAALPGVTRFYLSASDSWLIGVGPLLAICLVLKELFISDQKLRFFINVGGLLFIVVFFGLGYWAMTLPDTTPVL